MSKSNKYLAPYNPLPWQSEPFLDKSPTLLLTGSAGGGKSRLAGEKLHAFMQKYPGATGLMLRKAREYAGKSIVPFMSRTVIGSDNAVTMRKTDSAFYYQNGSMLFWGGMKNDEQREGLRSIGQDGSLDFVWIEEANAFTRTDFDEIQARMRGSAANWSQIVLTTNPDIPSHWINQDLIIGGEASVYYSGASDNIYNPDSYIATLDKLTGVLHQRLALGKWVQAEGAVYDEFEPGTHMLDAFDIPDEWRRIRVVDFGYTNAFVCQWWAVDDDGRAYRYREIYKTKTLVEDHAKLINELSKGEHIETTVCDHDAEDRATLERYGIPTIPANKAVSKGIQAVKARLRVAGDGKPRLYLVRGALHEEDQELREERKPVSTDEEITAYQWQKGVDGKPNKEQPVKNNDHGVDAARYLVMYLDDGPVVNTVSNPFYN